MIENAPVRSLSHKGLTIEGYSRAAVQSYWRVANHGGLWRRRHGLLAIHILIILQRCRSMWRVAA